MFKYFSLVLLALSIPALAELPPEIEKDRLFLAAKKAIEADNYEDALDYINRIENLPEIEIPNGIYYYKAEANLKQKSYAEAKSAAAAYLNRTKTGGRFYEKAIDIYNIAERAHKDSTEKLIESILEAFTFEETYETEHEYGRKKKETNRDYVHVKSTATLEGCKLLVTQKIIWDFTRSYLNWSTVRESKIDDINKYPAELTNIKKSDVRVRRPTPGCDYSHCESSTEQLQLEIDGLDFYIENDIYAADDLVGNLTAYGSLCN